MNQTVWPALREITIPTYEAVETLVYYDGPQMLELREGDQLWLSLAVEDLPDRCVRWLEAPVCPDVLMAMLQGTLTIRSVLLATATVRVTDRDPRQGDGLVIVGAFELAASAVPEECLPTIAALMPGSRKAT